MIVTQKNDLIPPADLAIKTLTKKIKVKNIKQENKT